MTDLEAIRREVAEARRRWPDLAYEITPEVLLTGRPPDNYPK